MMSRTKQYEPGHYIDERNLKLIGEAEKQKKLDELYRLFIAFKLSTDEWIEQSRNAELR